jgi:hypothetical protein
VPKIAAVALLAATIVGIAGCADSSSPTETELSPTPAATEAAAAPFDPCTDIEEDTLRRASLNPAARQPVPGASAQVTAACQYVSGTSTVVISSSTQTFEEFRDANDGRRIGLDIGERPTVIVQVEDPNAPCELAMKTQNGIVLIVSTISVAAREWGMDACGGIRELATVIEPAIGSR